MSKNFLVDLSKIDLDNVVADVEAIRAVNPQRFEMEQLTAIVYLDTERMICAGYKDITDNETWVRGHMPGMPLMPGIFMCEAAAQVCSYVTQKCDLLGAEIVGFGGLDEVRFRGVVVPGIHLFFISAAHSDADVDTVIDAMCDSFRALRAASHPAEDRTTLRAPDDVAPTILYLLGPDGAPCAGQWVRQ